jgi:MFS family permease
LSFVLSLIGFFSQMMRAPVVVHLSTCVTDAYDLFCISTVTRLLGRLYYYNPATGQPGQLPPNVSAAVNGVALCGTLCGQLFFGWLGDRLGRKKAYGSTLVLMILTSIASGMSFGQSAKAVMSTLCEFFFFPNTPELSSSFYVVLAILLQCCSSLCC